MGFFSSLCDGCEHPVLCPAATNHINGWMSEVVSVHESGDVQIGTYDGYGRIGSSSEDCLSNASVWHRSCWELVGSPLEFNGESPNAPDQGWFFDEGEHDLPDPRKVAAADFKAAQARLEREFS